MKLILGKKLDMTQAFKADGSVIPVTAVLAESNFITQIKKSDDKNGYNAVQVGFGVDKKIKKSKAGHLKGLPSLKVIKEFRVTTDDTNTLKRGDQITVNVFSEGDEVKVTGTSKGKGFQGVVKRHGFHGSPKTHGHKDQLRMPGSIGAGGVQRVFKGKKMAGHMGDERVTVSGLEIVSIDAEKNLLYIKGALPGARNSLVMIYGKGVMEIKQPEIKEIEQVEPEEIKEDAINSQEEKVEEVVEAKEEEKVEEVKE